MGPGRHIVRCYGRIHIVREGGRIRRVIATRRGGFRTRRMDGGLVGITAFLVLTHDEYDTEDGF
jgi:hypothetical protein